MTQWIRETFEKVFKKEWEDMGMDTIYGICHNVVKLEEYKIEGKNPMLIKLYGVFAHSETGTGTPGNIKKQKNVAQTLGNQNI